MARQLECSNSLGNRRANHTTRPARQPAGRPAWAHPTRAEAQVHRGGGCYVCAASCAPLCRLIGRPQSTTVRDGESLLQWPIVVALARSKGFQKQSWRRGRGAKEAQTSLLASAFLQPQPPTLRRATPRPCSANCCCQRTVTSTHSAHNVPNSCSQLPLSLSVSLALALELWSRC